MDKSGFTKKRAAALCAMSVLTAGAFCGGMATAHLAKASETKSIALTEDLAAVSTLADLENTSLKLYGAIDWAGYGRIALNETNRGNFHTAYVNDVKLGENSDFKNTNFTASGKHTVGLLSEANSCRIFSVAYTAAADGYLTISSGNLKVTEEGALWNPAVTYNGKLALSVTKNDADNKITPDTAGWEYYEAGRAYTPEDETVQVAAGDTVYLNFRAVRVDDSVAHCYVAFEYAPVFTYSETEPTTEPIDYDNVSLNEDLARVNSLASLKDTALSYYTGNSWAGYERVRISEATKGEHPQVYLNDVMINNASELELVNLRSSGTHTVGVWNENVNRVVSVGYTAQKDGYVVLPETTLEVVSDATGGIGKSFNGRLGINVTVNDAKTSPQDAGWEYYEAGKSYTIPARAVQVSAGDILYLSFFSDRISAAETNLSYVSFIYNPSFVYAQTNPLVPSTVHEFSHAGKLVKNAEGELINDVKIADDDAATYPFSYLYRTTAGSASGYPGTEDSTGILEMSANSSLGAKNIYAAGSYSGFQASDGSIITVAIVPDPNNVILGFTSPYDGKLTVSDISFGYVYYPNAKNNYEFYGNAVGKPFLGYAFRVLLNGKQVWPADGGWDKSLAKLYEREDAGYAAGDLIPSQSTEDIGDIYVRRYDKVYFEITRADLSADAVQNCDLVKFNPTFSVDTQADMSLYKDYLTATDYFDTVENENEANSRISYWYVDTSKGLYDKAEYFLMNDVDYAANAYTSGLLDPSSAKIGMNYLLPVQGKDAALQYAVKAKGNLTVSAETLFRNGNITLWQYYDLAASGNAPSADGVRMRVEINGQRVWPLDSVWKEYKPTEENRGVFDFQDLTFGVNEGDKVVIRINCGGDDGYDGLNFNPVFALAETETPVSNPAVTVSDPVDPEGGGESSSGDSQSGSSGGDSQSSQSGKDSGEESGDTGAGCAGGCGSVAAGGIAFLSLGMCAAVWLKNKRRQ